MACTGIGQIEKPAPYGTGTFCWRWRGVAPRVHRYENRGFSECIPWFDLVTAAAQGQAARSPARAVRLTLPGAGIRLAR